MTLPKKVVAALHAPTGFGPLELWRNLPSRAPTVGLFYPEQFNAGEQAQLAAFEAATSGIDHEEEAKDRWSQYALAPAALESLDFCFDAVAINPSRFTDGSHPVWYGASTEDASRLETAYHIRRQLLHELASAEPHKRATSVQRCMYKAKVLLSAGAELRPLVNTEPRILEDGPPYPFCNEIAAMAVTLNLDGLRTKAKRSPTDDCAAVFHKDCIKESKGKNHYIVTVERGGEVFVMGDRVEVGD